MKNQESKKQKILNIFIPSLSKLFILILLASAIVVAILFAKGFHLLKSYCDAFFISGTVVLGLGFFSLLGTLGAFDSVSYLGYTIGSMFRPGRIVNDKPQMNLVEYVEQKKNKRSNKRFVYVPYFEIGILFVIISIIILLFI